jgi:D-3-phosphoglycerate dehydrogenase
VCDPIAENGLALLAQHTDVDVRTNLKPEELLAIIDQYEGVVVRSATTMTAEIIERGHKLKVIGRAGAGLDNIDVRKAQEKQIPVVNAPDANTVAVAEHTMGLLLALARRLPRADESLKAGKWEKQSFMGTGLVGKTLGLVGFGRIGRQVAIRAQAFGMKILVNQLRPTPELNLAEARSLGRSMTVKYSSSCRSVVSGNAIVLKIVTPVCMTTPASCRFSDAFASLKSPPSRRRRYRIFL